MGVWKGLIQSLVITPWLSAWEVIPAVVEEEPAEPEYVYGENLITNSTFDVNLSGWTYTWGVADCTEVAPYEGAKSARLRRGGGAAMAMYSEIATEIGSVYEFTAYCKVGVQNDSTVVYLSAGEGHASNIDSIGTTLVSDSQYETTYKQITLVFTAVGEVTTISARHKDVIIDDVLGYESQGFFDLMVCRKRTEG